MSHKYVIDIHGMTVPEAKSKLERYITNLPDNVKEITVIHGYRDGDKLKHMVRYSLKSKKIQRKILTMNDGETILIIK